MNTDMIVKVIWFHTEMNPSRDECQLGQTNIASNFQIVSKFYSILQLLFKCHKFEPDNGNCFF